MDTQFCHALKKNKKKNTIINARKNLEILSETAS